MTTVTLYDMSTERMVEYALPEQEVTDFLQYLLGNTQWKYDTELAAEKAMRFRKRAMEGMRPVAPKPAPLTEADLAEKSYPELQELAKARGLRSVGVSGDDLIASLIGT